MHDRRLHADAPAQHAWQRYKKARFPAGLRWGYAALLPTDYVVIGERWGVTDAEVAQRYPCDDLVPSPAVQVWRGVTVLAPPTVVWPWLRQLRVAPYSYDWLDNAGRRSPRTLLDLPDPQSGDAFSCVAGRFEVGRVLSTEPGKHLTASIMGALMSYVLLPHGETTRLLVKIVIPERRWYGRALALGDWPMARRQLLNLKALAESEASTPTKEANAGSHSARTSRPG